MALSIEVQAYQGPSAAPCAVVIVDGAQPSGSTLVIRREAGGLTQTVRGGAHLVVYGAGSLIDYDVPIGVDVTYTATTVDGQVLSATYRVASLFGWLTDPYDPSRAVPFALRPGAGADVVLMAGALESASREAPLDVATPIGSAYPVAVGGVRAAASGIPLEIAALTRAAATQVGALLESGPIIVARPPLGLPILAPVSYLAVPDLKAAYPRRRRFDALTTYTGTAQLVRPVTKPVTWATWTIAEAVALAVGPGGDPLTLNQFAALAGAAGYRWADWERDPRIGGAL